MEVHASASTILFGALVSKSRALGGTLHYHHFKKPKEYVNIGNYSEITNLCNTLTSPINALTGTLEGILRKNSGRVWGYKSTTIKRSLDE